MSNFDLFSLKGKVIVTTGSTGGLGISFVKNLAWAGADLAILDIAPCKDKLEALAKEIAEEYGVNAKPYTIDISDEDSIVAVRDAVLKDFGHIDGLLNMVGINQHGPVEEYSEEDLLRILNVNVVGTFGCCKHFGATMCEQGSGSIVNIASIAASVILRVPRPMCGYSISKAGVVQMSKALAAEFGERNVRVNAISPGFMETRMSGTKGAVSADPAMLKRYVLEDTPMHRYCRADELTGAAIYFLSDASTFTNGTDLVIDGGYLLW